MPLPNLIYLYSYLSSLPFHPPIKCSFLHLKRSPYPPFSLGTLLLFSFLLDFKRLPPNWIWWLNGKESEILERSFKTKYISMSFSCLKSPRRFSHGLQLKPKILSMGYKVLHGLVPIYHLISNLSPSPPSLLTYSLHEHL